jgi:hypothetical protein
MRPTPGTRRPSDHMVKHSPTFHGQFALDDTLYFDVVDAPRKGQGTARALTCTWPTGEGPGAALLCRTQDAAWEAVGEDEPRMDSDLATDGAPAGVSSRKTGRFSRYPIPGIGHTS